MISPRRGTVRRILALGWVTVGVAPVVSSIALVRSGWTPVIDNAVIAAMTVDSVSTDPPLVGVPTSLGLAGGVPLSHPGPAGFWLLALPTKVVGEPGGGLVVGSVLVALASLAAIAVMMRRRDDIVVEGVTLALVGGLVASVGGGILASPLNPHLAILPLLAYLIAVWGVLAGYHRHLWVAVVAGSVAAQSHLADVPLVAVLVVLVGASLTVDVVRSSGAGRSRLTRRVIPVGVLLGVLAWIGPILDQLFGSRNLSRLLHTQSQGRAPAGLGHGLDVAVAMTSLPPRWLMGRPRDEDLSSPAALQVVLSGIAVTLALGLLVWALRRRDRTLASVLAVSLVALAAATVTSARLVDPDVGPFFDVESAVLYRLFWWPVGMLFALSLAVGAARVATAALRSRSPGEEARRGLGVLAAGVLVVAVVVLVPLGYVSPPPDLGGFYGHELGHAEAIAALPGAPEVVVLRFTPEGAETPPSTGPPPNVWDLGPDRRYGYAMALVAHLRLRGITVRFADEPDGGVTFSRGYRAAHLAHGDEPVTLLYLAGAAALADPPAGYRRLSVSGGGADPMLDPLAVPTAVDVAATG